MPDGKKKMISSKETGTVPKVKYWNNTTTIQHDTHHVANNLTSSMLPTQERHLDSRNRQRCSNYHCFEDIFTDDSRVVPNYNSLPYINMSGGTTSPSTSGSTSRRHSGTGGAIRKCDNITKYPDKKHIEDKLNQIREYLKVTSSLMSSVKEDQSNADEHDELFQMLTALRDSEKKLETLLVDKEACEQELRREAAAAAAQTERSENGVPTLDTDPAFQTFQNNVSAERNELEQKMEINEKKLHALHEHQNLLVRLQEKAENQLKDARKAQERLAAAANVQYQNQNQNQNQESVKNSEKNRSYERSQSAEVEAHQEQLGLLQTTNEGRGQLLRLLDARDNELCSEQQALQEKMQELNSKKQHIDQLVSQLHSYGQECDEGDDMANQIRQIVAMKEQLATLKDMLSAVKSTEAQLLHQNSVERSECGDQLPVVKSGNVTKASSVGLSDSETDRRWGKQSNKSSVSSSREQLQAELQAKKQELEELMYKDQDRTSAINQDVCSELVMNKAEQSFSVESVPSSWTLLQDSTPPRETCVSRQNVYSSDEEELENYSQLNNCNFAKHVPNRHVLNCNPTIQETASTPSINQNFNLNQQWSASGGDHKQQLELMTNLCQSLLEQQQRQVLPNQCSPMNVQWYSSYMQMQQALMLSTISQCCQLLWQQQQDINSLINTVSMMQQQQRSKPPSSHNLSPPTNETVGSACSLPTRLPSNNTEYASLAPQTQSQLQPQSRDRDRDRHSPQNPIRNMPAVSVMAQTHPHPHPPVWTGVQALNNQVAPGNRANNYWDNFRSYSRQNLLSTSTKSNEGSQNSLPMFERSCHQQPASQQRAQPHTLPKINIPIHEGIPSTSLDLNNHDGVSDRASSNRSERAKPAKRNRASSCRNRNEWNEETPQSENSPQKSKLFEVLRENVYKEVTLLISANENRPHFLIQLFRDLQLISSDPLRRSALHSIQSLISRSLNEATPANVSVPVQCPSGLEQCTENGIAPPQASTPTPSRNKATPSRCCPQSSVSTTMEDIKLDLSAQRLLMDLLSFLRSHNEDTFNNNLIDIVKKMILDECKSTGTGCNNKLQGKLDLLLNEYLSKYKGKRVMDIKEDLLKTIADVLLDEILAIETVNEQPKQMKPLLQETKQEKPTIVECNNTAANSLLFLGEHNYTLPLETFQFLQLDQKGRPNFSNVPRVDNGDLAEADQSRREAENEEGAVGGLLPHPNVDGPSNQINVVSANNELHSDLEMFINADLNN